MNKRNFAVRVLYSSVLLFASFIQVSARGGANEGLQDFLDKMVLTGVP